VIYGSLAQLKLEIPWSSLRSKPVNVLVGRRRGGLSQLHIPSHPIPSHLIVFTLVCSWKAYMC
jgi:hypothetical protein